MLENEIPKKRRNNQIEQTSSQKQPKRTKIYGRVAQKGATKAAASDVEDNSYVSGGSNVLVLIEEYALSYYKDFLKNLLDDELIKMSMQEIAASALIDFQVCLPYVISDFEYI